MSLLIFDFFAGTGSSTQAFVDAGHRVVTFELDPRFEATETVDIMSVNADDLLERYGRPDFVWASPPCTAFSVASIGHHWHRGGIPKTIEAAENQKLVWKARELAEKLAPRFGFLIENPRGMLRKLAPVQGLTRRTVTYCQYGDDRMKPTDLWGDVPGWEARQACSNGSSCHVSAPRGSRTGTQGRENAVERSRVPYDLGKEILEAIESV